MAERRAVSLLDFAIAASIAVVPVLLGVVAAGRGRSVPADPDASGARATATATSASATSRRSRPSSPRSCAGPRSAARLVTTDEVLAASRHAGANGGRLALARKQWLADLPSAAPTTRRRRRRSPPSSGGLRRRAAALQRPPQRPRRAPVGFDPARWFAAAAAALAAPIETPTRRPIRFRLAAPISPMRSPPWPQRRRDARAALPGAAAKAGVALAGWRPEQEMLIPARR